MHSDHEHESSNQKGYEDGFEGRARDGKYYCLVCYSVGYYNGKRDREAVQRSGSSNT